MRLRLPYSQILLTWTFAGIRYTNGKKRRDSGESTDMYGIPPNSWKDEVQGALGELALSLAFNLKLGDPTAIRDPDVGGVVDARTVDKPTHCLLFHERDKDDRPYVLVDITDLPEVTLVGWLFGREGKAKGTWQDKKQNNRPCYYVDRSLLNRDLVDLCRACHEEFLKTLKRENE